MVLSISKKILLGRMLTRFGDQAWDFAIPLVLVKLFPGSLQIAAGMFLCLRLASLILLPITSANIDRYSRMTMTRWGLFSQLFGVILAGIVFLFFQNLREQGPIAFHGISFWGPFICLVIAGILGDQGAQIMDILISGDLAPSAIRNSEELTIFNTQMRRLDLFMEVSVPVIAGTILLLSPDSFPLFGFFVIVLWNMVSFIPEYLLLRSIYVLNPDLNEKPFEAPSAVRKSIFANFKAGWDLYFQHPLFLIMLANSCLWLSALSPHGVLLTAYLKDGWMVPEWQVGVFRGAGAAFGVLATFVFPFVVNRIGFQRGILFFISFQFLTLLVSYFFFMEASKASQIMFLVLMLFSRIGMYGFTLGETQFRQEQLAENIRGRVNGVARSMNGLFNLGIFLLATFVPQMQDFHYLVLLSSLSIGVGAILTLKWFYKVNPSGKIFKIPAEKSPSIF